MAVIEIRADPTFYDSVPGVSQAKMAILYLIGKRDQSIKTGINFLNMTHLYENVKHIDDSIPGYGHIKALVTEISGDHERAIEIFEAAHRSAFEIIGGIVFGSPLGGIVGLIEADLTASIFDKKDVGVVDHFVHMQNKTTSDDIDLLLDLTLAASSTPHVKVDGIVLTNKKISVKLQLKKIGDSTTSKIGVHGKEFFSQPYTPMDHGTKKSEKNDGKN